MFKLMTDTSANLEPDVISAYDIGVIPFNYYLNGDERTCMDIAAFDGKAYYDAIRSGAKASTSQVPPQRYIEYMEPVLKQGLDILFIGMSSGISGSYSSAATAAQELRDLFFIGLAAGISGAYSSAETAARELRELYPERRIVTVDTLGASLGEGLFVIRAGEMMREGADMEEIAREIINTRHKMCQVFTVDDIMHLRRTGRLSNIAAMIGSVLNIKPLLKGDGEGKIVCFQKVRGKKTALKAIAAKYDELVENAADQIVGIAHADCSDDAAALAEMIRVKNPPKQIMTVCYEPVTGAHVGPGALALFFIGSSREAI